VVRPRRALPGASAGGGSCGGAGGLGGCGRGRPL